MPANLENSAVATGLKKVSFHSNSKEGQCQRILKLLYNCAHYTCQQGYAQNPSSQASVVHEWRTSRCSIWIQKSQRNQRSNCQHLLGHAESKGITKKKKTSTCASLDYTKAFDCVDHNKLWRKFLKRCEYQTTLPVS